jgi:hypothetical protein
MRCVDCLPLIEEYFDGEVEERTAEQMSAHLSSCADCSAALDALSFEQETYAHYDRGGLEVTPALWARVSAEIAREPLAQNRIEERPFLTRVRARVAAALSTLTARPALASSFALLLVGITAGSLWLSRVRHTLPPAVAVNTPRVNDAPVAAPGSVKVVEKNSNGTTPSGTPFEVEPAAAPREGGREAAAASPRETKTRAVENGSLTDEELNRILATQSASAQDAGLVAIKYEREPRPEDSPSYVNVGGGDVAVVNTSAQVLDPEQKEMARHVEQAQMLLRSIKNARAEGGDTVNVAYEKQLSRKLLGNNATLQLEAETRGDKETRQVLDSIEPYLLDIANMHDNASREEVRSIRERIDRKEIIAALQVY